MGIADDETRQRRALAAVYADDGTVGAWLVAETPLEALDRIAVAERDGATFVEFTLGNPDAEDENVRWNGRPVYVRTSLITAVGPPLDHEAGD